MGEFAFLGAFGIVLSFVVAGWIVLDTEMPLRYRWRRYRMKRVLRRQLATRAPVEDMNHIYRHLKDVS